MHAKKPSFSRRTVNLTTTSSSTSFDCGSLRVSQLLKCVWVLYYVVISRSVCGYKGGQLFLHHCIWSVSGERGEVLEYNVMQRLQFLAYVGGTLAKEVGDAISSKIRLTTLMGSSETKLLPLELNVKKVDWQYLSISPFPGHVFRPARDGLHELVVVRDPKHDVFRGVFSAFPTLDEYPMADLEPSFYRRFGQV